MPTATASAKARRLLAEVRVRPAGTATLYTVQGDTGTYRVVLAADGSRSCDCSALRERCSHVEAAEHLDAALAAEGIRGVAA